ncbi:MAG: ParB/RepB/Spo0J family partition protein [Gammaproteobacteria bacterium]|jgi:ParB family chromosome partitioning protein|nr:ParB/RepB/Spo0J family partition protein [Gammaproteobacteria bacterium]
MATKKRALGRGLDALLGMGAEQTVEEERRGDRLQSIPVDLIRRGRFQPRLDIKAEALQELAASIKSQGIVQPIVVRLIEGPNRYEIVAGERRWRAAQIAGLHEIPAIVRDLSDQVAASVALIENIQREQLNALEEAQALHRLIHEFGMTHQDVADAVGRSRATVSNLLRLLELHTEVKKMLEAGELEMGHARALAGLPATTQAQAAAKIIAAGMSVRQAEKLVKDLRSPKKPPQESPKPVDPDVRRLEESLAERLGTTVAIRCGRGGKGSLSISYNSLDELEGILAHIK